MKELTVTEAARNFSDLVSHVHYRGERTVLTKGGRPMVELVPARIARTGRELSAAWPALPHLAPREIAALERDLATARRRLSAQKARKWD